MPETITAMANAEMRPRARSKRLVVRRLGEDETLVYDLESHRAHCLNRTVEAVWRLCDGRRSVPDIARALQAAAPAPPDPDVVLLALSQLRGADLLVDTGDEADLPPGPSRRELLVRLGRGAVVWLPLVISIVAPTAAEAALSTCTVPGGKVSPPECFSGGSGTFGCCCTNNKTCVDDGTGSGQCTGPSC